MRGTSATTGKAMSGLAHLGQSIRDILLTPLGSRVMRRTYGSRLMELADAPMNRTTLLDIYAATIEAIGKWEPRFVIDSVVASRVEAGLVELTMTGAYQGTTVTVTVGTDGTTSTATA